MRIIQSKNLQKQTPKCLKPGGKGGAGPGSAFNVEIELE